MQGLEFPMNAVGIYLLLMIVGFIVAFSVISWWIGRRFPDEEV
jgi:hypothetical protein